MSSDKTRLEIGHVLFIDIVGYSKLLLKQQGELLRRPERNRQRDKRIPAGRLRWEIDPPAYGRRHGARFPDPFEPAPITK